MLLQHLFEDQEPALILVSPAGKAEVFHMSFRQFIASRNIPHIGPLVDAGNIWCNVDGPYIAVYWKTVKIPQINILKKELHKLGISDGMRCEVHADGQRISTTVGQIQPIKPPKVRKPSKQLLAADQMGVDILDDDLEGNKLTRVEWQKIPRLETHDPETVSLATSTNQYPGIYALHVGDSDFWFHKLIDDYGNDTTAWEIEIIPARGDVLVEDVQYTIPDESGNKAYSAILLTTRKVLVEGKDFRYVRELTDNRDNSDED